MKKNNSCLIITPIIAHYRYELLKSFSDLNINITIASDFYKSKKIKTLTISELSKIDTKFEFIELKNINLFGNIYFQKGLFKALIKKEIKNIVAVGNIYNLSIWMILIFKKFLKINITLWTHGNLCGNKNFKYRIKNLMYSFSDKVVFYEKRSEDFFKRDFPKKPAAVCYNSFKYFEFKHLRISENKSDNKLNRNINYFCFVGRLTPEKSLSMIIKSLNYIQNTIKLNVGFVFIGDGPEKNNLEIQCKKYKLKNIEFIEPLYDSSEIHEICKFSKGLVSPGNVGLSAITALSCGIPVITHDNLCNQMPEVGALVKGKTGYFFKENNFIELSNVLVKLLNSAFNYETLCYETLDTNYNPNKQSHELFKQYLNK